MRCAAARAGGKLSSDPFFDARVPWVTASASKSPDSAASIPMIKRPRCFRFEVGPGLLALLKVGAMVVSGRE
jgi:hypothetical protein